VIEGHFTLAGTVTGSGASLDELIASTREEFQLSSTSGIGPAPHDERGRRHPRGCGAGRGQPRHGGQLRRFVLLGIKGHSIDPSKNKVSKPAEAVLSFTNQVSEIEYDKVAVTAVRGPDRTIRLVALEMTAPDEHLKGTGQITYAKGLPVSQEPLSLELRSASGTWPRSSFRRWGFSPRTRTSWATRSWSSRSDSAAASRALTTRAWHDLLAKAATQEACGGRKKGEGGP